MTKIRWGCLIPIPHFTSYQESLIGIDKERGQRETLLSFKTRFLIFICLFPKSARL